MPLNKLRQQGQEILKTTVSKKRLTSFRPLLLSRHPSHQPLRTRLSLQPIRSLIRLGSTTVKNDGLPRVEINSVQGVRNSSSKLLMKRAFTTARVKTAEWFQGQTRQDLLSWAESKYPIISKSHHGSRGEGNRKHDNRQSLESFLNSTNMGHYIFEQYFLPNKRIAEYRIHCTSDSVFYSCRKMLKRDTPEHLRYQRHSDNCVWILESNPSFDTPQNWNIIKQECIKALNSLQLDIACFDVKVEAKRDSNGRIRENPDFIIIESNTAPSLAEIGINHYLEQIPIIIQKKYRNL